MLSLGIIVLACLSMTRMITPMPAPPPAPSQVRTGPVRSIAVHLPDSQRPTAGPDSTSAPPEEATRVKGEHDAHHADPHPRPPHPPSALLAGPPRQSPLLPKQQPAPQSAQLANLLGGTPGRRSHRRPQFPSHPLSDLWLGLFPHTLFPRPAELAAPPPLKPQPREQQQVRFHWPFHVAPAKTLSEKPDGGQSEVLVDGVALSSLPPHLLLAAVLRETLRVSSQPAPGRPDPRPHRLLRDGSGALDTTGTTDTGLDATSYCTTPECVQMMQDYEKWRQQNGFGTSGGRWG